MFFLLRTAFWLTVVVLLLPTNEQQRSQVYGTAEAAVKDVASFCDRNPETCAMGKDAFAVFMQKAEYGARMLMDFVTEQTSGESDPGAEEADVMPLKPALFGASDSQDTLTPEDREAAWGGVSTSDI